MNLENEFNFKTGLKSGKPAIFWQEKLSVRDAEDSKVVPKTKVKPKNTPAMAPKNPPAEAVSNKVPQTKLQSNSNKAPNNKNAPSKKQTKKMAAIDEKKKQQPASKGVVTMTQKQLDAILETIGQLTTENAELQTKLYSGEEDNGKPAAGVKYNVKRRDDEPSERATRDSGYYDDSAAKNSPRNISNGSDHEPASRHVRIASPPPNNRVSEPAAAAHSKHESDSTPGLTRGHLTKAEKLRMAQAAADSGTTGEVGFPWSQFKQADNKGATEPRSRQNADDRNQAYSHTSVQGSPAKTTADLKREQWEKERELLRQLEHEAKEIERRAAAVHLPLPTSDAPVSQTSQPAVHLSPKMMSKAELKKMQWEQERAEQQKQHSDGWNPFGRPGGGAPLKDNRGNLLTDYHSRKDDVQEMQKVFVQSHNFDDQKYTSHVDMSAPPAAIRSAFAVGDVAPNENRYAVTKEQERKRWLEDLEKQREEQRQRLIDAAKNNKEPEHQYYQHQQYHAAPAAVAPPPAPAYTTIDEMMRKSLDKTMQPSTFIRGQNVPVDDATKHEFDEKRRRELDHQAFIRQQIEEKQRKKDEEQRQRQQEDLAEEMRMQKEREVMALQMELDKLKTKAKEEEKDDKVEQLKRAIEAAHRDAEKSKQMLKYQKLQRGGHDISALVQTEHTQREPPPPSVAAVYVQPTHIPGLQLTARGDQPPTTRQYHHNQHEQEEESPYVEDRVLTPTKYQSQRRERAYVREFGVQAEFDEMNTSRRIARRNSGSAGILYNHGQTDFEEKENVTTKRTKPANGKAADQHRRQQQQQQQQKAGLHTKMKPNRRQGVKQAWFYQNQEGRIVPKASDRDVTLDDGVREYKMALREQRKQQLLQMAEANAAHIPTMKFKPRGADDSDGQQDAAERAPVPNTHRPGDQANFGKTKTINKPPQVATTAAAGKGKDARNATVTITGNATRKGGTGPDQSTSRLDGDYYVDQHSYDNYARNKVANGNNTVTRNKAALPEKYADKQQQGPESGRDFVPFLRSVNILHPAQANEPLPESRETSAMRQAREAYFQEQQPSKFGVQMENRDDRKTRHLMTDHAGHDGSVPSSLQQEKILRQLADLKKGLLQKRYEVDRAPSDLK